MRSFFQKAANVVSSNQGLSGSTLNIGGTSITVGDKIAEGGFGCIYRDNDNYGETYAVNSSKLDLRIYKISIALYFYCFSINRT